MNETEFRILTELARLTDEWSNRECTIDHRLKGNARVADARRVVREGDYALGWFPCPEVGSSASSRRRAVTSLVERGMVVSAGANRGRVLRLTDAGRERVEERSR